MSRFDTLAPKAPNKPDTPPIEREPGIKAEEAPKAEPSLEEREQKVAEKRQEIEQLSKSTSETMQKINEQRAKLGLRSSTEEPPSVLRDKERMSKLQDEVTRKQFDDSHAHIQRLGSGVLSGQEQGPQKNKESEGEKKEAKNSFTFNGVAFKLGEPVYAKGERRHIKEIKPGFDGEPSSMILTGITPFNPIKIVEGHDTVERLTDELQNRLFTMEDRTLGIDVKPE